MNITPEAIGTIIGTAFIVIASAMGIIRQRKNGKAGGTAPPPPPDDGDYVGDALDIASDYRQRLRALEAQAAIDREDCQEQIQLLVKDYDTKIDQLKRRISELERGTQGEI